jgi:hypothetical protein
MAESSDHNSSQTNILRVFDETSKLLGSKNKIRTRETESTFKQNVICQLEQLVIKDIASPELARKIFETDIPSSLENFLQSALDDFNFQDKDVLLQKFEQIKSFNQNTYTEQDKIIQQQKKFVAIQQLIRQILTNSHNKQILEEGLWQSYLQKPEQQTADVLSHKRLDSCGDQYYQQVQADPSKRAGYIMFSAFFHTMDQLIYIQSGGTIRLSFQDYEAGPGEEENALQRLWRIQTGNALTPPATPAPRTDM